MNMFKARVLFIESRCQQASVTSSAPIVHSARETNVLAPFFPQKQDIHGLQGDQSLKNLVPKS